MDDQSAVTISVRGTGTTDCLRELRGWLVETGELRGPLHLGHQLPSDGQLGTVVDTLAVAVGSGGAITVLASAVLSWIRHRTSDIDLKLTNPDGSTIELSGRRVRALDGDALRAEVAQLTKALEDGQGRS